MPAEAPAARALLEALVQALVDDPGAVKVEHFEEEDGTVVLELSVAEDDYGKVIGRGGRTASAIRMVVKAAGARAERRAGTDERPIVRLSGCSGRAAAERLRGERLLVAAERAAALPEDEWYAEELAGCRVV